jgi:Rrf2 family protein
MLELALHYGGGPTSLKDLAKQQAISEKYLWNLIHPLKSKGLIGSVRGAQGGYVLAKSPKKISLIDIVEILEGPLCIVDCVDNASICERSPMCVTRDIWGEVSKNVMKILRSITLEELVERHRKKGKHRKRTIH